MLGYGVERRHGGGSGHHQGGTGRESAAAALTQTVHRATRPGLSNASGIS